MWSISLFLINEVVQSLLKVASKLFHCILTLFEGAESHFNQISDISHKNLVKKLLLKLCLAWNLRIEDFNLDWESIWERALIGRENTKCNVNQVLAILIWWRNGLLENDRNSNCKLSHSWNLLSDIGIVGNELSWLNVPNESSNKRILRKVP